MNPWIRYPILVVLTIPIVIVMLTQFVGMNGINALGGVLLNEAPEWITPRDMVDVFVDIWRGY